MFRERKASILLQVPSMSKPKTRKKPKYLSLKLQLSTATSKKKNKAEILQEKKKEEANEHRVTKLKDIHNSVDLLQDDHVAFLFETATDAASTTLDGLLGSSTASEERDHPLSPPLTCVLYSYQQSSHLRGGSLLRAAMRSKEREASEEERWVSYNEVVEGRSIKKEQEEVTSCCGIEKNDEKMQLVVGWLKLDNYQEILDAWPNKDPFCLGGVHAGGGEDDLSNPQLVPHLHGASSVWLEGWRSNVANLWKVPEVEADIQAMEKDKEEEGLKWEHREASMMRYKKKRQSRLFAKRVRYQVRKLNAEKRPRVKGRFVKRSEQT